MKRLDLILNGKGGVGKSFFAVNFVQFLKDRGIAHVAIDSDNENSTLKRFHPDTRFPGLKHTGNRYLMNLLGVLLWPLGWALAALITQGILDFMTDPSFQFIDPTSTLTDLQKTIGVAAVGFWIIFSTIAAPAIIQNVIAHGIQPGGQLLAGGVSSFLQTAATTVGAAASASAIGIPVVTAGAAGMAAALSTMSSAANMGSAGTIIIAGGGLPPRSGRRRPSDDITGDRAVRDLIAKSKPSYY